MLNFGISSEKNNRTLVACLSPKAGFRAFRIRKKKGYVKCIKEELYFWNDKLKLNISINYEPIMHKSSMNKKCSVK